MFMLHVSLLVFFVVALFFGEQVLAGSFYFMLFAISLAFAFLEKKYGASFKSFYRYSLYVSDIVNLCALISLLCYKINVGLSIASLALFAMCLVVDLFSHNRKKLQSKLNVVVLICNSCFMFAIFPYFYDATFGFGLAIASVVLAVTVLTIKVVLACDRKFDDDEQKDELIEKLKMAQEEQLE